MIDVPSPPMLLLARESRGMTQKQLAAAASLSQGLVSKAENGCSRAAF